MGLRQRAANRLGKQSSRLCETRAAQQHTCAVFLPYDEEQQAIDGVRFSPRLPLAGARPRLLLPADSRGAEAPTRTSQPVALLVRL